MIVSRFKYCINGEVGFTSVKHDEQVRDNHVRKIAEEKVKKKYQKLFGVFNLTDIKKVNGARKWN